MVNEKSNESIMAGYPLEPFFMEIAFTQGSH